MDVLSPEELRVLGSLVEKQLSTPDNYPLTQNAVMAACNQVSNRNPVVAYDDDTVRLTLNGLRTRQLARILHTPGGRTPKHRHVLDEALELDRGELALMCVLKLRGPQTPGELRSRTERMFEFGSLPAVDDTLTGLAERPDPLVVRLERQPGRKEPRYAHLLGGVPDPETLAELYGTGEDGGTGRRGGGSAAERIAALEARVDVLEQQVSEFRGVHDPAG
ncbi:MAG: YceH family protein [Acidimicrobiia bacterium]